jgi:hypothetical protein
VSTEESGAIFVLPGGGDAPASPGQRRRAWTLIVASVVIGTLGAIASVHLIHVVPSNYDPICLQDPDYSYGIPEALDSATIWMVVAIWAAFAAACCVTWTRGKTWIAAAAFSSIGLILEGVFFTFWSVLTQACQ